MTVGAPSYKGFRYPAEIISHCVWLYHRFPLSLREVQETMLSVPRGSGHVLTVRDGSEHP